MLIIKMTLINNKVIKADILILFQNKNNNNKVNKKYIYLKMIISKYYQNYY